MIVKLFLIGSLLAAAVWLIRARPGNGRLAITRLATVLFGTCWVVAVLAPDTVTWIANRVGVGRGTDLVLYLLVVAFTFATVGQYQRLRRLDDRLADLTRAHALLLHEIEDLRARTRDPHA